MAAVVVLESLSGVVFLVLLAVSIVWLVTRRDRYAAPPANPRQVPTSEVLVDPVTGRRQRVYADPRTGTRSYVDEPPA